MVKHRNKAKVLNKKGNVVLDILYIGLFIMVFGIISIASYKIMTELQPKLDSHMENDASKNVTAKGLQAIGNLDYVVIMIVIGLLISTIIGAYFIESHPVFFIASLLLLIMVMVLVPVFSNVFDKFVTHSSMTDAAAEFTITTSFMDDWPVFFVIMVGISLIALYAKYRGGGGEV